MAVTRRQVLPWSEIVLCFSMGVTLGGYVLTMLFFGPWGRATPADIPSVLRLDIFAAAAEQLGLWGTLGSISGFCLLLVGVAMLIKLRR